MMDALSYVSTDKGLPLKLRGANSSRGGGKLKKSKLNVFYENELDEVLHKLNLWDSFSNNELKCSFCNKVLTHDNFGSILYRDGKITATCDSFPCLSQAIAPPKGGE